MSRNLNVPETCHTSVTTVIAIIVITLSMFCSCMESITIAGTGLREKIPIALSFWSYVFGITFSLSFHFIFENTIIPDNTTDILLYFGHGILASGVTYFDILALQFTLHNNQFDSSVIICSSTNYFTQCFSQCQYVVVG